MSSGFYPLSYSSTHVQYFIYALGFPIIICFLAKSSMCYLFTNKYL
jgi:hypothetical protein